MLRTSEYMLWIQSLPRLPYVYLWMPIGWNWLVMPIIVYVHIHLGRAYFKARGVKKDSVTDMTEIKLTNIGFNYMHTNYLPILVSLISIISGTESFLTPLALKWVLSKCMHTYTIMDIANQFQPGGICG